MLYSSIYRLTNSTGAADRIDDTLETASDLSLDSLSQRDRSKQRRSSVLGSAAEIAPAQSTTHDIHTDPASAGSPADLEEEASSEGAFNPETGEINWDCPCLGGMAHGPCGEDFKAAFSCFVFSTEEPKGMDCIDNFKKMQDCFREHPDVYAGELADDDEDGMMEEGLAGERGELEQEVQERRKAMREQQTERQGEAEPPKRLLEEHVAPASSTGKSSPAISPSSTPKKTQSRARPSASVESRPAKTEDSEQAASERRETMGENAPSKLTSTAGSEGRETRKSAPAPVQDGAHPDQDKFDADLELQPKAWHDARDVEAGSAENKKEGA